MGGRVLLKATCTALLPLGYRVGVQAAAFVAWLSAVSVMCMSQQRSTPQFSRAWQLFNYAAMAFAVLALISLIIVLVTKWAGGAPWPGFNWIAMIALPLAFLMMGGSVLRAVSIRRRL